MGSGHSLICLLLALSPEVSRGQSPVKCEKRPDHKPAENAVIGDFLAKASLTKAGSETRPDEYTITAKIEGSKIPLRVNRFRATEVPSSGTVVYLCGGPANCMDFRPSAVPANYDVMVFDHIGLGKNKIRPFRPEQATLEAQAGAVKALVQSLKLQNYALYGQSHGTAIATIAGALIAKDKRNVQPKAVLLEGVVTARRLDDHSSYARAADGAWNTLTAPEQAAFKRYYVDLSNRISAADRYKVDLIFTRNMFLGPKETTKLLRAMIDPVNYKPDDEPSEKSAAPKKDSETDLDRVYRSSACQSMKPPVSEIKMFGGLISYPYSMTSCDCRYPAKDYDPKDHQIEAPVIYVNGSHDPATPAENAKYHFDQQKASPQKAVIIAASGGHHPLHRQIKNCTTLIFQSAFNGNLKPLQPPVDLSSGCAGKEFPPGGAAPTAK